MSHITLLNYTAIFQFFILKALLEEANYGYSLYTVFFLYFLYDKFPLLDTVYFQPHHNTTTFLH